MFRGRNRSGLKMSLAALIILCGWMIAHGQDPNVKPKVGYGIALTGPGGMYAYLPKRWGTLHVNVINRQQQPLELFSATYFDDEPTLQYGRKIWLPPRSRMQTWHPVRIPEKVGPDGKTVHFHSLVMNASESQEVLIRTESGQMEHDGFLQVGKEMVTGLIDILGNESGKDTSDTIDLIGACRVQQLLSRRISSLTDAIFVPGEESLEALEQLVISDSRPMSDAAGIGAIRRWLFAGGHLWVMLDQVDPALLEMLLGDEFHCELVDRVSLTQVQIQPGVAAIGGARSEAEYDEPIDMVRVLTSDVDVAYKVNEWPAAFWKTCGEGRLLVTTLGARGWMTPRVQPPPNTGRNPGARATSPIPASVASEIYSKYIPNDPMGELAAAFLAPRKAAPLAPTALEPIVQEYVGYAIPPRWLIVGLLAGFSGILALGGVWLWRIGRLEWLGGLGPVLAIVISLVLVGIGRQQRQAVPATAANLQFVQTIQGTDDFLAEGQLGIFSPDSGQSTLGAHGGGWVMPEMGGLEGTTRRMIWTDIDQWQWHHLPAMAGLRNAKFRKSGETSQRVVAEAEFGPDGLTGRLQTATDRRASDAVIATVGGRIGVELSSDGTFTARSKQVFSGEQFLGADLLSDEQNRRRKTLQQLLTNPARIDYPSQPTLLFWTDPWDLGFEFDAKARSLGAALVAVPLELHRPPTGTEVSIPSPFLIYRPVAGPDGAQPSGLYDPRRREWAEKSWPSSTWLRFQVPQALLPIQPLGGRLAVSVTGPMGKLQIFGARDGQILPLKTWMDPVGTIEFPIPNGDLLTVSENGGILLRIDAGDPDRPELTKTETSDGTKTNYWRIESLNLELKARATEPEKPK